MINNKNISTALILAFTGLALTASTTFAATNDTANKHTNFKRGNITKGQIRPAVVGIVSAVNTNSITVTSKQGDGYRNASTTTGVVTTWTIDTTNAVIMKNNATSSVSNILVGDIVMIQGTVTGTNVVATTIRDGAMNGRENGNKEGRPFSASTTPMMQGNGEPVIAGKVSAINGSVMTITNNSNITYSVDTTNAKITQGKNTITITNITVGDIVVVQGTVNGNSVIATSVIDQTNTNNSLTQNSRSGLFGGIGNFFKHMFGF